MNQTATPRVSSRLTVILECVFGAVLGLRFVFPFFYNPIHELWSDMSRHWEAGRTLFHPWYINSVDPKTYQVWMYLVRLISQDNERIVAFFTGLLCLGFAYFWYRALREICSKNAALGLSIALGLHPSMLVIYRYFLNETAALTFCALAIWLTLRASRKQDAKSFYVAVAGWLLAGFSKQILLPVMAIALLYLFWMQKDKRRAFGIASAMFIVCAIPAAIHTYNGAHIFSPFGYTGRELINRASRHVTYEVHLTDNKGGKWAYYWAAASFYIEPLHPFAQYKSYRDPGTYIALPVNIDEGRAGWQRAIDAAEEGYSWHDRLEDFKDNFVFLFFAPSWPDSDLNLVHPDHFREWMMHTAFHARWVWPFLFAIVLTLAPFSRLPREKMLIVSIAYALTLLLLFQQLGVMEGRYRKPLEPFLIVSAYFLIRSFRQREEQSLAPFSFAYRYFLPASFRARISAAE